MEINRELKKKNRAFEERKSRVFEMINSLKIMKIRDAGGQMHMEIVDSYGGLCNEEE